MKINGLEVTSNFVEIIDENSIHCELGGCIRLVHLADTEFKSVKELEKEIKKHKKK